MFKFALVITFAAIQSYTCSSTNGSLYISGNSTAPMIAPSNVVRIAMPDFDTCEAARAQFHTYSNAVSVSCDAEKTNPPKSQ